MYRVHVLKLAVRLDCTVCYGLSCLAVCITVLTTLLLIVLHHCVHSTRYHLHACTLHCCVQVSDKVCEAISDACSSSA
jgi:hypothetical protein